MTKPRIANTTPVVKELDAGTYFWCACGESSNQPWCDRSHQGSDFTPEKIVLEQPKKVFLCRCKQTGNPPYCDGSHSNV